MGSLVQHLQRGSDLLLGAQTQQRRATAMTALAAAMMVCCSLVMRMLVSGSGVNTQAVLCWAALAPIERVMHFLLPPKAARPWAA